MRRESLTAETFEPASIPVAEIPAALLRLAALQNVLLARLAVPEPKPDDGPRLLSAADAAKALGISTGALYELARLGRIGSVKVGKDGSRAVRFTPAQIEAFINSREKSAVDSFPH